MGCRQSRVQDSSALCDMKDENGCEMDKMKQEALLGIRAQLVRHHEVEDVFSLFHRNKVLGEGMSGKVYEVEMASDPGHCFALKEIKKRGMKSSLVNDFRLEIQLLIEMDHPNVIKLFDTYEDGKSFFLLMEECTGGELFDHLSCQKGFRFQETYAARLIAQMLRAVHYLHTKKICHRDLKLENFVFDNTTQDAQLKLIDFGLSCRYSNGTAKMKSLVGTPYYIAPEVLRQVKYDQSCDLWSLGVIAYIMVSGIPPFNGTSQTSIMDKAKVGDYRFPEKYFATISNDVKDFISKLMKVNPSGRMNASDALQHRWIRNAESSKKVSDELVQNFKEFKEFSRLKKAALEVVTFRMNVDEIKELRDAFQALDQDGNGLITFPEMKEVLSKRGLTPEESFSIFQSIDTNGSGLISYSEFITASIRRKVNEDETRWREAFARMDVDGNGYLDKEDFRTLLGNQFKEEEVDKMIETADASKDGKIDLEEFIMMIRESSD